MKVKELIDLAALQHPSIKQLFIDKRSISKEEVNSLLAIDLSTYFVPTRREPIPLDDLIIKLKMGNNYDLPFFLILKEILRDVPGEGSSRLTQAYINSMKDEHMNIVSFLEKCYLPYLECNLRIQASDFQDSGLPDSEDEADVMGFGIF